MARRKSRTLTELELEIMQVIWGKGEATVEDIHGALQKSNKPLARPSIRTMLAILREKGYLTRKPFGRGHVYRPKVQPDQAQRSFLKDIVERVFDGSASNLVTALVNSRMVSQKDLAEIRRLIREHEKGGADERN